MSVLLSAKADGIDTKQEYPISFSMNDGHFMPSFPIHRLAAKCQIRLLEQG